jgi:hypothetical protein
MVTAPDTAIDEDNPAIGVGEQSFPISLENGASIVMVGVFPYKYPDPLVTI